MNFIYCEECRDTVRETWTPGTDEKRWAAAAALDEDVADFLSRHSACRTQVLRPTGRATASAPWYEPLAERVVELEGESGRVWAIGRRRTIEEPIRWQIRSETLEERAVRRLDRAGTLEVIDRTLFPHHASARALARWADVLDSMLDRAPAEDFVPLHDDPARPNVAYGFVRGRTRAELLLSTRRCELDEVSQGRLLAAFDDALFPPVLITRRLVTS